MPSVIVVTRDVPGFASAAILTRYVRHYLLEEARLSPRELRFSDPERVTSLLGELVDLRSNGRTGDLTKVMIAGVSAPKELGTAEESLARLKYQGVEVDWHDHRPWSDREARARLGSHCRLVLPSRLIPSGAQFLHDCVSPDDFRSRNIVGLAQPPDHQSFRHPALRRWGRRWYLLLSSLRHWRNRSYTRPVVRRLAFDYHRFGPDGDSLIREEETKQRWLEQDFRLRFPFPVNETRTRQLMAVVDIREESGSLPLDPQEVARDVARRQKVRYTLLAVTRDRAWVGELYSWPAAIGDLARVPGIMEAGNGDFSLGFPRRHLARFHPSCRGLSFFDLSRDLSARL